MFWSHFSLGSLILGVLLGWFLEWLFVTFVSPSRKQKAVGGGTPQPAQGEVAELKMRLSTLASEREALAAKVSQLEAASGQADAVAPSAVNIAPDVRETVVDDLTRLAGIGPKTAELMAQAGIGGFQSLADMDVGLLERLLQEHGVPFNRAKVASWPEQAKYASRSDWEGLKSYLDSLKQ